MIIVMNIYYVISSNDMPAIYYVTPNITSSPCPIDQPCNTLDAYIKNSSYYIRSNTTFVFYPGNHLLNEGNLTIIKNCENIQFVGIGDVTQHLIYEVMMFRRNPNDGNPYPYPEDNQTTFSQSSSVIKCGGPSGFAFINVTNLTILNITIYGCGAQVPSSEYTKMDNINDLSASLLIINSYSLKAEGLSIQAGSGYGLMGVNMLYSHIVDSSFLNNNVPTIISYYYPQKIASQCFYYESCMGFNINWMLFYPNKWSDYNFAPGGNALLLYTDTTSNVNNSGSSLEIDKSIFALGIDASLVYIPQTLNPVLTTPCYQYGTGLTISAHQTTY